MKEAQLLLFGPALTNFSYTDGDNINIGLIISKLKCFNNEGLERAEDRALS